MNINGNQGDSVIRNKQWNFTIDSTQIQLRTLHVPLFYYYIISIRRKVSSVDISLSSTRCDEKSSGFHTITNISNGICCELQWRKEREIRNNISGNLIFNP